MIRLAGYQGIGKISRLIRFQTGRSQWSHFGGIHRDNTFTEAWQWAGVDHVDEGSLVENLSKNHQAGTVVDIFYIESTLKQALKFEDFLLSQVGKGYDWRSVFRFLTGVPASKNDRWFCSELIAFALMKIEIYLQRRICSAHMSPQLVGISPVPIPTGQIITI